jgi:hypothetical protein
MTHVRKIIIALSIVALITGTVSSPTGVMAATQLQLPTYFKIVAKHSGKCLDVPGGNLNNGAKIQQWDCHGGDNQAFLFVPAGNGTFGIFSKYTGKVLDVEGWSHDNGANILQWTWHGGENQRWRLVPADCAGTYYLVSEHSGLVMDILFGDQGNGAQLIQHALWGGAMQQFSILPVK